MRNKPFKTPSRSSPKNSRRACLCADNTYSRKCCDGSLQAQGIGNITGIVVNFLAQENGDLILQEDNSKIIV
jgi:hypothetical protein